MTTVETEFLRTRDGSTLTPDDVVVAPAHPVARR